MQEGGGDGDDQILQSACSEVVVHANKPMASSDGASSGTATLLSFSCLGEHSLDETQQAEINLHGMEEISLGLELLPSQRVGDGDTCSSVPHGSSCLLPPSRHGYNFVVVIPAGASNIDIRQRGYKGLISDDNYLALKNGQGKYLLNGHFIVSAVERDLMVKGSVLRYSGTGTAVESLQAFKPIQEPLTLEVLSVGKMTPPRVRYSFYLPKESKDDKTSYKKEGKAPPDLNNSVLSLSNRLDGGRPTYKRPSYKWAAGGWEACSVTCGSGLQKRAVACHDSYGHPASECEAAQRPVEVRSCGEPCPAWEAGPWAPCSKSCGRGFKRRMLKCVASGGRLLPRESCSFRRKPQELDFCTLRPC